ncbi:MAG: FadR family transcriptional regulator [Desulfobacteraceae bacterium]|nr:FadR family transcriptional regulator [Desulfobacteraceae bacterium]
MQQQLLKQLKVFINELDLKPGDRLPAERKLALQFGVGRNSLRRLLHTLEGRGLVHIKKSSGTILRSRFFGPDSLPPDYNSQDPEKLVADQLETAFLFFPRMVELAALRINAIQLEELQKRNVALGQSIFSKDPHKVWTESLSFFRLVAFGTNNTFMISIMEQICSVDMEPFKRFFETNRQKQEQLFADHVNILHALKAHNPDEAKRVTLEYVRHLCRVLGAREKILPDTIREQLKKASP